MTNVINWTCTGVKKGTSSRRILLYEDLLKRMDEFEGFRFYGLFDEGGRITFHDWENPSFAIGERDTIRVKQFADGPDFRVALLPINQIDCRYGVLEHWYLQDHGKQLYLQPRLSGIDTFVDDDWAEDSRFQLEIGDAAIVVGQGIELRTAQKAYGYQLHYLVRVTKGTYVAFCNDGGRALLTPVVKNDERIKAKTGDIKSTFAGPMYFTDIAKDFVRQNIERLDAFVKTAEPCRFNTQDFAVVL